MGSIALLVGIGIYNNFNCCFGIACQVARTAPGAQSPAFLNTRHQMDNEQRFKVWEILSYAWTEIGVTDDECVSDVQKAGLTPNDLKAIDEIIFRNLAFSFAPLSFLLLPMCLWMAMPDWGFDEEWLRKKMNQWNARWTILNFINPFVLLGYPSALLIVMPMRSRLRKAILTPEKMLEPGNAALLWRRWTERPLFVLVVGVIVSAVLAGLWSKF